MEKEEKKTRSGKGLFTGGGVGGNLPSFGSGIPEIAEPEPEPEPGRNLNPKIREELLFT